MRPYYQSDTVTLYWGDSRELLPHIDHADAMVTDPPWPGATPTAEWTDDPVALFHDVAQHFPRLVGPDGRLIVQIGCTTDPRLLRVVPASLPFVRVCWLRYAVPRYRGTTLDGADIAWVATQYYAPTSVYGLTPVSEAAARAVARGNKPEPVHRWELPTVPTVRIADELSDLDDAKIEDGLDVEDDDDTTY